MNNIPPEAQELIAKFNQEEATRAADRPKREKGGKPEKPDSLKAQDILNAAVNLGCEIRKGKGSHKVIIRGDGQCMPVPVHGTGAELGRGLASKIYKFIAGKK